MFPSSIRPRSEMRAPEPSFAEEIQDAMPPPIQNEVDQIADPDSRISAFLMTQVENKKNELLVEWYEKVVQKSSFCDFITKFNTDCMIKVVLFHKKNVVDDLLCDQKKV